MIYGIGSKSLGEQLGVVEEEAAVFLATFRETTLSLAKVTATTTPVSSATASTAAGSVSHWSDPGHGDQHRLATAVPGLGGEEHAVHQLHLLHHHHLLVAVLDPHCSSCNHAINTAFYCSLYSNVCLVICYKLSHARLRT